MDQSKFLEITQHDLNMYYKHTWMRLSPPGKAYRWYCVTGFQSPSDSSKGSSVKVFLSAEASSQEEHKLTDVKWDFKIPESGCYNFKNGVVIISRFPVRHTSKAITKSNTYINNLLTQVAALNLIPGEMFKANNFSWCGSDFNTLLEDTAEIPFSKGFDKILSRQNFAYAMDRRISISQGIMSKNPTIWLKNRVIGELNQKNSKVYPLHDLFIPELENAFLPHGVQLA